MKKIISCKQCHTEYCDESFGMNWDNNKPLDRTEIDNGLVESCPACGCKEFDVFGEDICYKDSKCSGWNKSMEQLRSQQIFCSTHSATPEYTGEIFKYCPWCGEEIIRNKEE